MNRRKRAPQSRTRAMDIVLAPPAPDDVIGLLKAWRFWFLGGLIGALLGAAAYAIAPPPYRARATVNVDFHLEQTWPRETDRQQFYYLERETRKLMEIAMSDATLGIVAAAVPGTTVEQLRAGALQLAQPGSGGWHFHADDRDAARSALLARTWARTFCNEVQRTVIAGSTGGLEPFITADLVQAGPLVPKRTESVGLYMFVGAGAALAASALGILLIRPPR